MVAPPEIFDRALWRRRRTRHQNQFASARFLLDLAQSELSERLHDIRRNFKNALYWGPGPLPVLPNVAGALHADCLAGAGVSFVADEELLPLAPQSFDLIISALSLQHANDLPGALIQIRRALKPDGLFLAVLIGGESLHELRQSLTQAELAQKGGVSPRVFPFADKQQMGALLGRAGFALPVVDSDILRVSYRNFENLTHDLRAMGWTNIIRERVRTNPGKAFFSRARQFYADNFKDTDGHLQASFEVIYLQAWAPHESQQKPLTPGSAKMNLAHALGVES